MLKHSKKLLMTGLLAATTLMGCTQNDAAYASKNISTDADNFKVIRRIVFLNSITNDTILTLEGNCSITKDNEDNQLEAICKHGETDYKKHYLGLSDNTPYLVEQLDPIFADPYHFKIVFKPKSVLPLQNVEVR